MSNVTLRVGGSLKLAKFFLPFFRIANNFKDIDIFVYFFLKWHFQSKFTQKNGFLVKNKKEKFDVS